MSEVKNPILSKERLSTIRHLASYFSVDDVPLLKVITPTQLLILGHLVFRDYSRLIIMTSTQYGKSMIVAIACVILTCILKKKVCVVAPSGDKAKIIMRYYIEHLGDDPIFWTKLEKDSKLDRLRQEESKERITLRNGGGIFIISAMEKNAKKSFASAMGEGADIVIGDEFCLVNDNTEATIFRMIAGKGKDGFYCKIGNPFYSEPPHSHFKSSWEDPNFAKIFVNDKIGLEEGRYTEDFLEEAKKKPLYDVLFRCNFPNEDEIDPEGYRKLLSSSELRFGALEDLFNKEVGKTVMGIDVGGGGDEGKFVIRRGNFAFVALTLKTKDTTIYATEADRLAKEWGIGKDCVFIDDTGIGRGASDILSNMGYYNCGVSFGATASRSKLFSNRRVEMYWDMAEWVKAGGVFDIRTRASWQEATWTRYKVQTGEKKIIMEDKERVKAKFNRSPDTADALVLTFYKPKFVGVL